MSDVDLHTALGRRPVANTLACELRRAAAMARQRAERIVSLLANDSVVARRYVGTLGGVERGEPLDLFFVGRQEFAREFEVYFRETAQRGVEATATTFRGNVAQCAMHRRRLAREAAEADFVAWEVFPGAGTNEQDILHYPMLDGYLRVQRTVEEQIRRVRSRAQRRLLRDVLESGKYRSWVESGPDAFDAFQTTLHEPYVRGRFGASASIDSDTKIRRLYAKGGCILFVAECSRPMQPVAGTLLLDNGGGELAYQFNGFGSECLSGGNLLAERTAALEVSLLKHAIDRRFTHINLGYTRAILSDGLFVHKARLGCSFKPVRGTPLFRIDVRPTRRAAIFARYPLLAGTPGAWTALLGYDDTAPTCSKHAWHAKLKAFRVPGLAKAIVWTRPGADGVAPSPGERGFREAISEAMDLPEGLEFRRDE